MQSHSDIDLMVEDEDDGISLTELAQMIGFRWKSIVVGGLLSGALGFGGASLMRPVFTARTIVMPPQQQQSSAAAALNSLGALAGLAGGGLKSSVDQYIALMQSVTVSDRLIDRFKLMDFYEETYRSDARQTLLKNAVITAGKKDGLILIEVDDYDPNRAAEIANAYVDELRLMTNTLAVSEAQQRRRFFEQKLEETKSRLTEAQMALQASGFNASTLRAEPKAVADGYARLRAEATAAEVRLQTLRRALTDAAPEVQQQQAQLAALRSELVKLERKDPRDAASEADAGYVGRYRDYKYQETLFELYAKQFEIARLDESREGAIIQVVDVATTPDKKSKPKRGMFAVGFALLGGLIFVARAVILGIKRPSSTAP
ncbi:Wzz/FepE/Etk N-terminal domain-containing protein [Sphaerotilus sp.]|uniref:Wzz/FepE/Etk N-terminal domain-containing protein n=1 Tax=Sphaerotilus sp. TaxID=2093942 RepID=UPI00286E561B|nr:Wzz/FepE/Etk N-terminal domain-containing protein [Sphaerotilus sp.]